MISINGTPWGKITATDVEQFLSDIDGESFYVELKNDSVDKKKITKEISALANTYGGYIFLGVEDDRSISGCQVWDEERINQLIHTTVAPTPNFDIKGFTIKDKKVFLLKIEEGVMPPYVTNQGQIFERCSSSSCPIKETAKLLHLYQKRVEETNRIKNEIEMKPLSSDNMPDNLFGYIDMGIKPFFSEPCALEANFYDYDLQKLVEFLKTKKHIFNITKVGHSLQLTIAGVTAKKDSGEELYLNAGINNYLIINRNGSVKCRIILTSNEGNSVDPFIINTMLDCYRDIYSVIMGDKIDKLFIHAHRFEKLTVVKQFVTNFNVKNYEGSLANAMHEYLNENRERFGENTIIDGNRIPDNDYVLMDRLWFETRNIDFSPQNLYRYLFATSFFDLGYPEIKKLSNKMNDEQQISKKKN